MDEISVNRPGVVVIGGVIGGLTVAARLCITGRRPLLLEAENQMGGRYSTIEVDGFSVPTRLGQACSFWVPPQPGWPHGLLDRSHLCTVSGTIDGDPVEGTFMDDHLYSAGVSMRQAGFAGTIENYWMQWLVEYEDGSLEGGSAWRGQPGLGFARAHHYLDGHSRARRDGRIEVARTESGSISQMTLSFPEVSFTFGQEGSYDGPFHTYGRVASCSREKTIAKSWHYVENWPVNMYDIEDYQAAHLRLYGRPLSMRRVVEGARFENGALVPRALHEIAAATA